MLDLKALNQFPSVRVLPGGTTNTQIDIPRKASKVTIHCETRKFYVAFSGTDGGTPETNKFPMPAGSYISIELGRGSNRSQSMYLATDSSGGDISLLFEE